MYYLTKLQLSLRSPCPRGYKRKSFSGTPIRSKHNHLTPVTCWYSRGHGRVILEPWCSSRGWGWGRCSIVMYYWTFGPSQPVLASELSRSWLGLPAVEGEVLYLFQTDGDVTVGYRSTSGASLVMPMACAIWVFAIRGGESVVPGWLLMFGFGVDFPGFREGWVWCLSMLPRMGCGWRYSTSLCYWY